MFMSFYWKEIVICSLAEQHNNRFMDGKISYRTFCSSYEVAEKNAGIVFRFRFSFVCSKALSFERCKFKNIQAKESHVALQQTW